MFDLTSLEPDKLSNWLKTVGIEIDSQYIIGRILIVLVALCYSIAYFESYTMVYSNPKLA